ncbi:undecaprenyl-phosphate alpha-N-acetylglucosaminyl 1-phosphate transferase [Croceivirga lutea]|uniref:glycosyltransferase family 4 protein n=1 Tax=Croceivirga lutea TaxID=1775167 RepID=UPI001639A096|nr:MraY family glycosyltransferase [Croceivirga lutea]GGG55031.1 undecaprenyl-phosphate alpha-N-acetylglucosaminyl 1-phosphate transferase [Croceivirga lutea]
MLLERIQPYLQNPYLLSGFALVVAYWLTTRFCPIIIKICHSKKLLDDPNGRSAHKSSVPTYGGVAMFLAFAVVFLVVTVLAGLTAAAMAKALVLLAALTVLFFLGMKDDMIGLHPRKKFIAQFITAALVIFLADVRIDSLGGIFGIQQLPYAVSVAFSFFVYMLISNAYNLIDGIDGLAGAVSTLVGLFFAACFLWEGQLALALPAILMAGVSLGFLRFNLSKKNRLFMGDSGSLFMGFLMGFLAIAFLQTVGATGTFATAHPPVLVLAVLSYPLLDTLRVFSIRIANGRSPFSADKNHMHHRLLQKGFSHAQATLLIVLANMAVIGLSWGSQTLSITLQCVIVVAVGTLFYMAPVFLLPTQTQRLRKKVLVHNPDFASHPGTKANRKVAMANLLEGYKPEEMKQLLKSSNKVSSQNSRKKEKEVAGIEG